MATVTVAKYGDRVVASPKMGESEKAMVDRLCAEHGKGSVFVDGVAASHLPQPAAAPAPAVKPKKKRAVKAAKKPAGKK